MANPRNFFNCKESLLIGFYTKMDLYIVSQLGMTYKNQKFIHWTSTSKVVCIVADICGFKG